MIDITKLKSDAQLTLEVQEELGISWKRRHTTQSQWSWERHIANNSPSTTLALVAVVEAGLAEVKDCDARCAARRAGEWGNSEKNYCEAYTARGRAQCPDCPKDEVSDALREALKPFRKEQECQSK